MRFKGTLFLLLLVVGLGLYVYFYEIQGEPAREQARLAEKQLWKVESDQVERVEFVFPDETVTAVRTGEKSWKITSPRSVEADAEELNRIASSAADLSFESVVEAEATDVSRFALDPPEHSLGVRTKEGQQFYLAFGRENPTGTSTYAQKKGSGEVLLVPTNTATTFRKRLDDLRERAILRFDQYKTQAVDLRSLKGRVELVKEQDRWWIEGKNRIAASSSAVNDVLGALANSRLEEFLDDPPEGRKLGFDRPTVDVTLTVGEEKSLKRFVVGSQKSGLGKSAQASGEEEWYVAKDDSRDELFFVGKEFVDRLVKTARDLRDDSLASFKRWEIDSVRLSNPSGSFQFLKSEDGGDWLLGAEKKKVKWDTVQGILDTLEKSVKEFIDHPGDPTQFGLDPPRFRVVLKDGDIVAVDCSFGGDGPAGVYARVQGEDSIKVVEAELLEKLTGNESDFLEPTQEEEGDDTPPD